MPPPKPYKRRKRSLGHRTSWQPKRSRQGIDPWKLKMAAALTVLGLIAVGAVYVVYFSPLFAVTTIKITGTTLNVDAVKQAVQGKIDRRKFLLWPTHSLVGLVPADVADAAKTKTGDVASVIATKQFPHTVTVNIQPRQQAILWKSGGNYYLVDQLGVAYAASQPRTDLMQVEDSTGVPVTVGKPVVGTSFITTINQITQLMAAAGIKVDGYQIPETTFEVRALVGGASGWYALFDATRPVQSQVTALQQALAVSKPTPNGGYADLRIPGRVYMK